MKKEDIINKYELDPHIEGGFYKKLFNFDKLSSILYLLYKDDFSKFHKLCDCDETWYLIEGGPLIIHAFMKGEYKKIQLTSENNEYKIPKNTFFAVENLDKEKYSLSICIVSPKFTWETFISPSRSEVVSLFPKYEALITKMTTD